MKWTIFVLYGSLEDIARGRSDGDDVGACWQGGDAEGVVGAIDLRDDLDRVGHWRGRIIHYGGTEGIVTVGAADTCQNGFVYRSAFYMDVFTDFCNDRHKPCILTNG